MTSPWCSSLRTRSGTSEPPSASTTAGGAEGAARTRMTAARPHRGAPWRPRPDPPFDHVADRHQRLAERRPAGDALEDGRLVGDDCLGPLAVAHVARDDEDAADGGLRAEVDGDGLEDAVAAVAAAEPHLHRGRRSLAGELRGKLDRDRLRPRRDGGSRAGGGRGAPPARSRGHRGAPGWRTRSGPARRRSTPCRTTAGRAKRNCKDTSTPVPSFPARPSFIPETVSVRSGDQHFAPRSLAGARFPGGVLAGRARLV